MGGVFYFSLGCFLSEVGMSFLRSAVRRVGTGVVAYRQAAVLARTNNKGRIDTSCIDEKLH